MSKQQTLNNHNNNNYNFNKRLQLQLIAVLITLAATEARDFEHPHVATPRAFVANEVELSSEYWRTKAQTLLADKLEQQQQLNDKPAKNVILFLGDGMSVHTLAATRAFMGDSSRQLSFEKFPYVGLSKTYAVDQRTPDSASTATAYLSGVKANYGTIGVSAQVARSHCSAALDTGTHTESLAKWAQDAGKWTGLVTTARVTHASPAGVYAHTPNRDWEYDQPIVRQCGNGTGNVDIARQLIEWPVGRDLHVILGGGRRNFRDVSQNDEEGQPGYRLDKRDLIADWLADKKSRQLRADYVWYKKGLKSVHLKKTDYLLGLFSSSHCAYHGDLKRQNLDQTQPTLSEMTVAALKLLARHKEGYFLFVEGARIDMAHHENRAQLSVEDTQEFAQAVELARNMTSEADTLIVVTSDHSHTMSINGYPYRGQNIFDLAPNKATDKLPFTILSYANGPGYTKTYSPTKGRRNLAGVNTKAPDYEFMATVPLASETHGGEDVAIFASGPLEHYFTGSMEQSSIPALMAHAANIGPFSRTALGMA